MSFLDKAKDAAKNATNSDKIEEVSDKALDKAEELAMNTLGPEHAEKVRDVREKIDERIGNENRSEGSAS